MNADSYYDPPEPTHEREVTAYCDTCDADTNHLDLTWAHNVATRECLECGEVTELEDDE